MFNKKNQNGSNSSAQASSNGSAPMAPPQMRKPSTIAPLPPKRKEANIPAAAPQVANTAPQAMAAPVPQNESVTFIGNDIIVTGSLQSSGEIIIEGTIEGDVRAQKIVIKNNANVTGELASEELVIHGRVNGVVRGLKILLASDCILNGDILHETLSIESGAQFEGSCKRSDDPLGVKAKPSKKAKAIKPLAAVEEVMAAEE
ncbi:MAG: polymer-forming cytoskeletal protein [Alphaproteobacteria bacterium]|nr:polymer-forming cytoskeletal protein [Alphaproteobacteria bacterium]